MTLKFQFDSWSYRKHSLFISSNASDVKRAFIFSHIDHKTAGLYLCCSGLLIDVLSIRTGHRLNLLFLWGREFESIFIFEFLYSCISLTVYHFMLLCTTTHYIVIYIRKRENIILRILSLSMLCKLSIFLNYEWGKARNFQPRIFTAINKVF